MSSYDTLAADVSACPILYGDFRVTKGSESLTDQYSIALLRESAVASLTLDSRTLLRDWTLGSIIAWLRPAALLGPVEPAFIRPEYLWQIYASPGARIDLSSPRGCLPRITLLDGEVHGLTSGFEPELKLLSGPTGSIFRLSWTPWELLQSDGIDPDTWAGQDWHLTESRNVASRIMGGLSAKETK